MHWVHLLSDRPLVRTQPGVPKMTAVSRFSMVYSVFCYHFPRAFLPLCRNDYIHFPANWLRTIFPALLKKRRFANTIFPPYFSDGADASNAASVLANSGELRSCSTRASKSNVAGAGSFGSSGARTERRSGLA